MVVTNVFQLAALSYGLNLFRRKARGEVAELACFELAFPYDWHYDTLKAFDDFRRRQSSGSTHGRTRIVG
jgi:hypothetical protein